MVTDLEAIEEALAVMGSATFSWLSPDPRLEGPAVMTVQNAARALVRILRDGKEPDYEASAVVMYPNEIRPNVGQVEMARRVVDAAIKGRILVNPEE